MLRGTLLPRRGCCLPPPLLRLGATAATPTSPLPGLRAPEQPRALRGWGVPVSQPLRRGGPLLPAPPLPSPGQPFHSAGDLLSGCRRICRFSGADAERDNSREGQSRALPGVDAAEVGARRPELATQLTRNVCVFSHRLSENLFQRLRLASFQSSGKTSEESLGRGHHTEEWGDDPSEDTRRTCPLPLKICLWGMGSLVRTYLCALKFQQTYGNHSKGISR